MGESTKRTYSNWNNYIPSGLSPCVQI
jgi:hypothetical protein